MHRALLNRSPLRIFSFAPNRPYSSRESPISAANMQGPSRSPMALVTPRPCSANRLVHWLMACSEAPAQTISAMRIQKRRLENSRDTGTRFSSSTSTRRGTWEKKKILKNGTTAQAMGR